MWICLHFSTCGQSVVPAPFVEVAFSFSVVYFCLLCQKLGIPRCVDLCLGLLFDSIDPLICFYASTMLVLLL